MKRSHVCLRPVEMRDAQRLLEWRNSPRVRSMMFGSDPIAPAQHARWMERITGRTGDIAYVFERGGVPLGVVQITSAGSDGRCSAGYYLGEEDAPKGSGAAMGWCMLETIFGDLGFRKVSCETFAFNDRSIAFLRRLGFTQEGCLREQRLRDGRYEDVLIYGLLDREWRAARETLARAFFEPEDCAV